jgi:hypothetical protein
MRGRDVRYLNIALGAFVFVSAFLWPHPGGRFVNTWLTAAIVMVSAAIAIKLPVVRFVTAAAGLWLVTSLFAWPQTSVLTLLTNAFLGAGIALASVIGPRRAQEFGT